MTHPLPGSAKRAGYVTRRKSQNDYLRLLIAPPRDDDVLVHDEIVYYKAPKHVMSLGEPLLETAAVLVCLLYTSPSPRDATLSRMPSSA